MTFTILTHPPRRRTPRPLYFHASKDQATRLIASPRIETISSIWLFSTIRGGDIAKESPLMRR